MSKYLSFALEYEKLGLCVIPILPGQKVAAFKWKEFQDRKSTVEEIVGWWKQWPDANIGIVTGKVSDLCVVDFDRYKEGYNESVELDYFPDTLIAPTVLSPRLGAHLWFRDCGLNGCTGVLPHVDFRGEGNYIIVPPSINGTGRPYEWSDASFAESIQNRPNLPNVFKALLQNAARPASSQERAINNNNIIINERNKYKVSTDCPQDILSTSVHNVQKILQEGNRNSDIFHISNCLAKGGCEYGVASQVIEILSNYATPPCDKKESDVTLLSAYKRVESKERNIHEEVKEYIIAQQSLQEVHILATDCLWSLQLSTRNEKKAAYAALSRLCNEGNLISKAEGRGIFKIINADVDKAVMDLTTEPEFKEVDILLPLGLSKQVVISPGNIIVVSGSKSSGKTAFAMNVAWLNQDKFEVRYLNSEMHETEFKKRMKKFGPLSKWKIKGYKCHTNFEDYIEGKPNHLYIVDFLEIHENFYEIGKKIRKIHEKIGDSVVFIALQMKSGASLGRGGDFSAEKARLYLTMDFIQDKLATKLTIYDAKEPRPPEENVRGMWKMVKIVEGNKLSDQSGKWMRGGGEARNEDCREKSDKWYQK